MRQTSKRARRSRALMIVIFVLLAALVIWGLTALLGRLLHYGTNATVSAKDHEQLTPIEPSAVDKTEEIPENTYDPSCFYMDGGFLRYESDTITSQVGIDVSAHQQEIDWQRVAKSGVQFAILRVDEQEAREEARFVLDKISGYLLAFPVFFDWEKIGSEARSDTMDLASLTIVTDTFCTEIRNAGYQAGLYFNQQLGYEELHLPSLQTYTFWLAEYNDTPSFAYHFDLWQYSASGTVDGIEGDVDLNLAFFRK